MHIIVLTHVLVQDVFTGPWVVRSQTVPPNGPQRNHGGEHTDYTYSADLR